MASVRNWPSNRPRRTPNAKRTVISRRRRTRRAIIKFATFAQAMSSTIAATAATQSSTRPSAPPSGPAEVFTAPTMANGVRKRIGENARVEGARRGAASDVRCG
jgi:hypothetical protein